MAFSVRSIGRVVVFRFAGLVQARVVCDREHAEGLCIGADGFVIVAAGRLPGDLSGNGSGVIAAI